MLKSIGLTRMISARMANRVGAPYARSMASGTGTTSRNQPQPDNVNMPTEEFFELEESVIREEQRQNRKLSHDFDMTMEEAWEWEEEEMRERADDSLVGGPYTASEEMVKADRSSFDPLHKTKQAKKPRRMGKDMSTEEEWEWNENRK
eukprot:Clim_evm30s191 gene=Clim_evmTU30s191